ncbi:MAG: response regulator [Oscillochloris sp.]|nr:response regulator [Oscillochloris sp.]
MLERIQSRLQYKLMLGFSLVLLCSLLVVSVYTQFSTHDILISQARNEQMRLAIARVSAVERRLADISTDLLILSQDSSLTYTFKAGESDENTDRVGQLFQDFIARSGRRYTGICLTDLTGQEITCVSAQGESPAIVPVTPLDYPTLASPSATVNEPFDRPQMHISAIRLPPLQGDSAAPTVVLRYRAALHDSSGDTVAQIILDVAAQPIFDTLIDSTQSTRTIIINQDGTYLFGPTGNLHHDRPTSAMQILSRPGGTILGAVDSSDTFTTFHEIDLPNESTPIWVVIYDRPISDILDPINWNLSVNIGLTTGLLLIGLGVSYMLTRSIVQPVRALAAAAERVATGDLQTPIRVDSRDEIGSLARTLDRTVVQLRISLDTAQARRREAETLYTTAIALSSILDVHRLLDRILDELQSVVPYDSSTVQLVRGEQVEIIGAYGLANPDKLIGTCFPLYGVGPNAEVARRRATVILDDAPTVYARFNDEPYRADPIRSWMGVPLIFGERLIGMITIDKYAPNFYSLEHARIASAFAAQAAIALENAWLYEAARDELAERRRSEQALMRLSAILEATTDVVGSADTEGRLLFLNRAGRRLLGINEQEDIAGRPIHEYIPHDSLEKFLNEGLPVAIRDGIWSGEVTLHHRDAEDMPASQVIIAHRDSEGKTAFFSTIIRDISDRLRAEEQLRQAQKMEAVGRLAGGVSHDFNNILTVIMGECDLMLHNPMLNDDLRQGLDQIRQAGVRAAALTRQLLAFSRRQVLQPAIINLNEIITPIQKMLRRLIGEDVSLQTDLLRDLATVRADPSQIEQVILNLCINGRDAMPQGGELCITTTNITVEAGDDRGLAAGEYVLLTVRDTGSGIDEAIREHIFEPFFTTKPQGKGTGLGLATVHGIVQQSGGMIRFDSVMGQGTSFYVYLPVATEPSYLVPNVDERTRHAFVDTVVLLVEDDRRVRRLARQILITQGLTVIEAADGTSALQASDEYQGAIDLLLSDIVMPGGLNGTKLAAHIRTTRPQIKVLLMSGYTDTALSRGESEFPGIQFIQKPFTPAYLVEKVAETLDLPASQLLQHRP